MLSRCPEGRACRLVVTVLLQPAESPVDAQVALVDATWQDFHSGKPGRNDAPGRTPRARGHDDEPSWDAGDQA